MSQVTNDDICRALAELALEGEKTLLQDDAPDFKTLLLTFLRDHVQDLVERQGMRLNVTPPQLATADTWEPTDGCWTVVNKTALRHGGRVDASTTAPALPGVSYLPASFSGEYYGNDLQAEIARGDVTLYPPGVAVPKAALSFAPQTWWSRAQLAPNAKQARECADALKGTQFGTNAEERASIREKNEGRTAVQKQAAPTALKGPGKYAQLAAARRAAGKPAHPAAAAAAQQIAALPQSTATNSFSAGMNPLSKGRKQ